MEEKGRGIVNPRLWFRVGCVDGSVGCVVMCIKSVFLVGIEVGGARDVVLWWWCYVELCLCVYVLCYVDVCCVLCV